MSSAPGLIIFPAKRVSEQLSITFDFTALLAPGELLLSAVTTVSVYSGVDASPASMLSGLTSAGSLFATQKIIGGLAGVIYILSCVAASAGQNLSLLGHLAVRADSD